MSKRLEAEWERSRKLLEQSRRECDEDERRQARFQREMQVVNLKMTLGIQATSKRLMDEANADLMVLDLRRRNGEFSRRTT
jgi:hypothetical protein